MRILAVCLAIAMLLPFGSGCRGLMFWPGKKPPPCTFKPDATKQEIVAHVNRFASSEGERPPLTAWRTTSANIALKGVPFVGTIDVEAPSRLRIIASMPIAHSQVADIGSNDEMVWFWGMPSKEIVTIRHEHVPAALQTMQVPFEPQWLMEVLGVVPMNVDDFDLRRAPAGEPWVDLVAQRDTPTGQPVIRVVRVDLCHGQIIEHRIEQTNGSLIAAAKLGDYSPDVSGQFMMPHFVRIEWPVTETSLTMRLGAIHANPVSLGASGWQVPQLKGLRCQQFVPPGMEPTRTVENPDGLNSRASLRQPLYRQASADSAARMDVFSEPEPAGEQPAAYFPEASRSSSDRLLLEPESGPRPFPAQP